MVSGMAARTAGVTKIILHSHAAGVDGNHRWLKRGFTDDVADCLNGSGQIMWHVLILLQNGCFQILPQKRLL